MIQKIDMSDWTPTDLQALKAHAGSVGLTEDEFIERTAKQALYNLDRLFPALPAPAPAPAPVPQKKERASA